MWKSYNLCETLLNPVWKVAQSRGEPAQPQPQGKRHPIKIICVCNLFLGGLDVVPFFMYRKV